jgi:dolichol-phosphate mannosyltransferase
VVPLYRTAGTVEELCERIAAVMVANRWSYEVILVNDKSPDGDLEVARRAAEDDAAVCVLDLDRNRGQSCALLIGLALAGGEWAVILDGDLQDPPESIPRLIEVGRSGFDAVFGGRCGRYEPWHRLLTSRLFKTLQGALCGVPRDAGLFAALSARQVRQLVTWPVESPKLVPMIGLGKQPLTSVPIERHRRHIGSSSYSSWRRLQTAASIFLFATKWRWTPATNPQPVDWTSMIARRFGSCADSERARAG